MAKDTILLSSNYNITQSADFDLFYRYQSPVRAIDELHQLNMRFGYSFDSGVETSLLLSNLLNKEHLKPNTSRTRANSYIQRSALLKLVYQY